MKILAIETSCDETAAALVEGRGQRQAADVVSSVVSSSEDLHKKTGGIVPEVAARKQIEVMLPVLKEALGDTKPQDLKALAITVGPGLIGSLLVGVETARCLAYAWDKPLVAVNHLKAHLYANWIRLKKEPDKEKLDSVPEFPAVGLVVSGGHTDLVLMQNHKTLIHLGATRDDAAGEAFDKTARLLGLGYPGGPAIEAEASRLMVAEYDDNLHIPRPMINSDDYDFSFSGLKTAVKRIIDDNRPLSDGLRKKIAWEVQEAIAQVLWAKAKRAIKRFSPKSLLVAGGVAANSRLRQLIKLEIRNSKFETDLYIPPIELCTDNAAYIGACAIFNWSPSLWKNVRPIPDLSIAGF